MKNIKMAKLPSLTNLRHLEATCRLGGVTRAAKSLLISHAAISQSITALERQFGVLIEEPMRGELRPTRAALALISGYRRATEALASAVDVAMLPAQETFYRLRVDRAFADGWLRHRTSALLGLFPSTTLSVGDVPGAENVAISRSNLTGRFTNSVELFKDVLVPVCAPTLAAKYDLTSPLDLIKTPLICGDAIYWRRWIEAAGLDANLLLCTVVMSEQRLRIQCAVDGVGVTLVNPMFVLPELKSGALQVVSRHTLPRPSPYRAYWRSEDECLEKTTALVRWVVGAIQDHPSGSKDTAMWMSLISDSSVASESPVREPVARPLYRNLASHSLQTASQASPS